MSGSNVTSSIVKDNNMSTLGQLFSYSIAELAGGVRKKLVPKSGQLNVFQINNEIFYLFLIYQFAIP